MSQFFWFPSLNTFTAAVEFSSVPSVSHMNFICLHSIMLMQLVSHSSILIHLNEKLFACMNFFEQCSNCWKYTVWLGIVTYNNWIIDCLKRPILQLVRLIISCSKGTLSTKNNIWVGLIWLCSYNSLDSWDTTMLPNFNEHRWPSIEINLFPATFEM